MTLEHDLKHPDNLQDPFPAYRWLRDNDPVHWAETLKGWVITRYEDVYNILQQPLRYSADRFRKLGEEYASKRPSVQDVARLMRDWFIFRDPPDHTRQRRLLHKSFTPRDLDRMRPRIQQVVNDLFDRVEERGEMDFIADFAFPLPASVIAIFLGCPVEDIDALKRWSDDIAAFVGGSQAEFDNIEAAKQGLTGMSDYFREIIAQRRGHPRDDLITLMLAAEDDGEVMTPDEVVANCILLVVAGHETTTNLLGTGLYHLLRNPGQFELLRNDPALVNSTVEELLRYDGPVPALVRIATEEEELHGQRLRPGQMLFPFLSSANRDERKFPRPDEMDITRHPNRHLAFGYGIHFCLGGPLARVESQIAFSTLLRRFEGIELVEERPRYLPQIFLRGLEQLPIAFRPVAEARRASA